MAERHHVVLLGAPGAGKGTQARRLAERLDAFHLEAGELLRQLAAEDSPLGAQIGELITHGRLVPDDLTNRVVGGRLRELPPERGFVLDGYPRNTAQARALHRLLRELGRLEPRPLFLDLEVPRDVLMARLRARRDLEGRADDTDEVIARRLDVYQAQTAPVLDAVADWADVVSIDGDQPPDAVAEDILRAVLTARRPSRITP